MLTELQEKTIYIDKENETYLKVYAVDSIMASLYEFFSFYVPNYRFTPAFRNKTWSGKIYLYNKRTGEIYFGLLSHIKEYAKLHEYSIEFLDKSIDTEDAFSVYEAEEFAKSLDLHACHDGKFVKITPRDYQIDMFRHAVQSRRALLLSPTSSGKSLFLQLLVRYYQPRVRGKILIVVPKISLVTQLFSDFGEYSYTDSWDVREQVHMIHGGADKGTNKKITISTWQSIHKLPKSYFEQFDVVIIDECHLGTAECLKGILHKCTNAKYRFGCTGTLDGTLTHKLVLEGLLGKVYNVITTKELMDRGDISDMVINCIMLHYPKEVCKSLKDTKYQDELAFIVSHPGRNKFIRNLTLSMKKNTLVLFQLVERHGKPLYEDIKSKIEPGRNVYYISGEVEANVREEIRKIVETESNAIIIASQGVYSTGVNLRNLHNIILSSPSKSRIQVLQSIGRGLRKSHNKDKLNLFDLSDDLSYKTHNNYTLKHFLERMKIYNSEKFDYKLHNVKLK